MQIDGLVEVSVRLAYVLAFVVGDHVVDHQVPLAHIAMLDVETLVAVDLGRAEREYVAILGPDDLVGGRAGHEARQSRLLAHFDGHIFEGFVDCCRRLAGRGACLRHRVGHVVVCVGLVVRCRRAVGEDDVAMTVTMVASMMVVVSACLVARRRR